MKTKSNYRMSISLTPQLKLWLEKQAKAQRKTLAATAQVFLLQRMFKG